MPFRGVISDGVHKLAIIEKSLPGSSPDVLSGKLYRRVSKTSTGPEPDNHAGRTNHRRRLTPRHNPTTLLNRAPLAFAFFYATERCSGGAVVSRLPVGGRPQSSRVLRARPLRAGSSSVTRSWPALFFPKRICKCQRQKWAHMVASL